MDKVLNLTVIFKQVLMNGIDKEIPNWMLKAIVDPRFEKLYFYGLLLCFIVSSTSMHYEWWQWLTNWQYYMNLNLDAVATIMNSVMAVRAVFDQFLTNKPDFNHMATFEEFAKPQSKNKNKHKSNNQNNNDNENVDIETIPEFKQEDVIDNKNMIYAIMDVIENFIPNRKGHIALQSFVNAQISTKLQMNRLLKSESSEFDNNNNNINNQNNNDNAMELDDVVITTIGDNQNKNQNNNQNNNNPTFKTYYTINPAHLQSGINAWSESFLFKRIESDLHKLVQFAELNQWTVKHQFMMNDIDTFESIYNRTSAVILIGPQQQLAFPNWLRVPAGFEKADKVDIDGYYYQFKYSDQTDKVIGVSEIDVIINDVLLELQHSSYDQLYEIPIRIVKKDNETELESIVNTFMVEDEVIKTQANELLSKGRISNEEEYIRITTNIRTYLLPIIEARWANNGQNVLYEQLQSMNAIRIENERYEYTPWQLLQFLGAANKTMEQLLLRFRPIKTKQNELTKELSINHIKTYLRQRIAMSDSIADWHCNNLDGMAQFGINNCCRWFFNKNKVFTGSVSEINNEKILVKACLQLIALYPMTQCDGDRLTASDPLPPTVSSFFFNNQDIFESVESVAVSAMLEVTLHTKTNNQNINHLLYYLVLFCCCYDCETIVY